MMWLASIYGLQAPNGYVLRQSQPKSTNTLAQWFQTLYQLISGLLLTVTTHSVGCPLMPETYLGIPNWCVCWLPMLVHSLAGFLLQSYQVCTCDDDDDNRIMLGATFISLETMSFYKHNKYLDPPKRTRHEGSVRRCCSSQTQLSHRHRFPKINHLISSSKEYKTWYSARTFGYWLYKTRAFSYSFILPQRNTQIPTNTLLIKQPIQCICQDSASSSV